MSKLGCASSLFKCFGSKKKRAAQNDTERPLTPETNETSDGPRVRFSPGLPHSPLTIKSDKSVCSVTSGKSSVYADALEDHPDYDDDYMLDDDLYSLQIDGQYFFSARDDESISYAFEGIKQYPPIPTTEPDISTAHTVSTSDLQTLLYEYQHPNVDAEEEKKEADVQHILGTAMEHQARSMMSVTKDDKAKVFEITNVLLNELKVPDVKVRERGYPGELTEDELEAVKLFKKELHTRDQIYSDIVYSFSSVEKEAYALCRFLRARKFDVVKVFELLDQAKDGYKIAKEKGFYPNLKEELGFSRAVFLSQYPAVFSGNARNGCPVMYLRAGMIKPEGIKCLVSIDKVDRYFWNDVMYSLCPLIGEGRKINPNLVRCENLTIYDLKGVSRAQIGTDTFEMIKVGNQVMTSFPETLHCLLIINAPSWFGLIWSVIKKLIDPRTASKIEVFTSSKVGIARMNELIDEAQIPSDYGGSGPALTESAAGVGKSSIERRDVVVLNHLFQIAKKQKPQSHQFTVSKGQNIVLKLYTRCKLGAKIELNRKELPEEIIEMDIIGDGEDDDQPYSKTIGTCNVPGDYTLKLTGKVPGNFLILGTTVASGV